MDKGTYVYRYLMDKGTIMNKATNLYYQFQSSTVFTRLNNYSLVKIITFIIFTEYDNDITTRSKFIILTFTFELSLSGWQRANNFCSKIL